MGRQRFVYIAVSLTIFSLSFVIPHVSYADAFVIDGTGGDCATIGDLVAVWDQITSTCTLQSDISTPFAMTVTAPNIVLDGKGHSLSGSSITISHSEAVTLKNINLVNGSGVDAEFSTSTLIQDVQVSGGTYGFIINYSPNVSIIDSGSSDAAGYGLSITGQTPGLILHNDSFSQSGGVFSDHHNPVYFASPLDSVTDAGQNFSIDQTNLVDGKIFYYFENANEDVWNNLPNAGMFMCVACNHVTLASTTFSNIHNIGQVYLYKTTNSTISRNTVENGTSYGMYLLESSGNIISDDEFDTNGTAIESFVSLNNRYEDNSFTNNKFGGIDVNFNSIGNTIQHNNFTNNSPGVTVTGGGRAEIIQNNFYVGSASPDIVIYDTGTSTILSEDLPVGGNYYEKNSECSDENADQICDSSYFFPGSFGALSLMDNFPWSTADAWQTYGMASSTASTTSVYSNILFLPGIEASRLYRTDRADEGGGEKELWEPFRDGDVRDLFLNADGTPPVPLSIDQDVYTRDVIDEAYLNVLGPNIYKTFLSNLANWKTDGIINDYSAVPYDWRLSLDQILNSGVVSGSGTNQKIDYMQSSADPYIISELRRLTTNSATGKVTIIAHSTGGFVAKALLQKLAEVNDPLLEKVDKLILVAVPQLGTPAAIGALLHGYDQGIPSTIPLLLSTHVAREFAQNLPSAYNLLPSAQYFASISTPVVIFDSGLIDWGGKYGNQITSNADLNRFLSGDFGRVDAGDGDLNVPDQLRNGLLASAQAAHDVLDNWTPPASLEVSEIAGWGVPTTMSGITYMSGKIKCEDVICSNGGVGTEIKPRPTWTIDGDGTVVTPSALWTNGGGNVQKYWVDLGKYNKDNKLSTGFGLIPFDHKNILEVSNINSLIKNILEATSTDSLPQYISTSTPVAESQDTRLVYSLHSPLTFDMYDDVGNHTGISTTTGMIEENIPGTYYVSFGGDKYFFTDMDNPVHIIMNGYATSTFTLSINQFEGDTDVASTTFLDIPVTPDTSVTLNNSDDTISSLSDMDIDENGDGISETMLTPKINDIVIMPEKSISNADSTYTINNSVTKPALSNGSIVPSMPILDIASTSKNILETTTSSLIKNTIAFVGTTSTPPVISKSMHATINPNADLLAKVPSMQTTNIFMNIVHGMKKFFQYFHSMIKRK